MLILTVLVGGELENNARRKAVFSTSAMYFFELVGVVNTISVATHREKHLHQLWTTGEKTDYRE